MPTLNSRKFHPVVSQMESRCLLAGGIAAAHPHAMVHQDAVVNLKPTQVGTDAVKYIKTQVPSKFQSHVVLKTLTADSTKGTITGLLTSSGSVPVIGTINASIKFTTSIAKPATKNVQITLSKFSSFLSAHDKLRVQKAVVTFIQQDHDKILAQLPTS